MSFNRHVIASQAKNANAVVDTGFCGNDGRTFEPSDIHYGHFASAPIFIVGFRIRRGLLAKKVVLLECDKKAT